MIMKNQYCVLLLCATTFFGSCVITTIESEPIITKLEMIATPVGGGKQAVFVFEDVDSFGGKAPTIKSDTLLFFEDYNTQIRVYNNDKDITARIIGDGLFHQVFYEQTFPELLNTTYTDFDDANQPIGLTAIIDAIGKGQNKFTITLRHDLDKEAEGVREGSILNAGGVTDVEAVFNVVVR
jgi:hypothetical protein